MGKRGPPPKPSAAKKLKGTYKAAREARALGGGSELAPPPGVPECPAWLDSEAKKEWRHVVPQLAELGVLCDVDAAMLANYCAAMSLAIRATKAYQKDPFPKAARGKLRRPNPMIRVAQEARAQARLLAGEFGLSPSARTRVKAPEKPAEGDADEDFLFGTGADPDPALQ